MIIPKRLLAGVSAVALCLAACGSSNGDTTEDATPIETSSDALGVRVVSPIEAAATLESPPEGLVVLDVRTDEEFGEGHIDGAVLLDFYRTDFAEQVAALDRSVPYVLYCRSGNRSSQTRVLMDDLGFASVDDIDGGILGWLDAGLPIVGS